MLGFVEPISHDVVEDKSHSFKLVPWISWDEWKSVRESLFSSSPNSVANALQRICSWRSKGCIPVVIEVTASIIDIQQKDPFFREDLNGCTLQSEEMLSMLYCMAIMRLVNVVVEKNRKRNEISIGEAADAIGIPRMLIDIRHECSHRDLPSLQLARLASKRALDWLVSYYWEPQGKEIPNQKEQTANLRKEIKRRLREVALCLKERQISKSCSSHVKGKRVRPTECLYGRNKFLFLVAGKTSHSNSTGFKKQLAKSLRNILRLYSSSSLEVVSILLEYLLNALDSSNSVEYSENAQIDHSTENMENAYDDWKSVVLKLSSKEPDFLFTLCQAVLEKMESHEALNFEIGDHKDILVKSHQIALLAIIFEWLVERLNTRKLMSRNESAESKDLPAEKHLRRATIVGLLRKCLQVSSSGNKHLIASALTLAQLAGHSSLIHKLKKLSLLNPADSEANSHDFCSENLLSQHQYSLHQDEERFALTRHSRINHNPKKSDIGVEDRWFVTKSWNRCPIGMLPHKIGFSGRLPVLHCMDELKSLDSEEHHKLYQCGKREAETDIRKLDSTYLKKAKETEADGTLSNELKSSDGKQHSEMNQCGKREAENDVEELVSTPLKKAEETEADCAFDDDSDVSESGIGYVATDGYWKSVGEKELLAIQSDVRLLV